MSYVPNLSTGGVAQMTEYANALSLVIDQVNTYHPLWTAGVVAGLLDGWTFSAGLDGSYTAVANLGGGQVRVTTAAPHGMAAGRIVALTSSSVAGYQPPNPTVFKVTNVNSPTTFDVVATFTTTATGFWTAGSCLTAGASAAGKYELSWQVTAKTSSGSNKNYLFEPLLNVAGFDQAATSSIISANGPNCFAGSGFVTIAAGDVVTMCCQNQTDATDVTIVDMGCRLKRYASP